MRRSAAATFAAVLSAGLLTAAGTTAARADDPAPCETPATHQIAEVQGAGDASPLAGQTVRVEGVVTGDFHGADQLKGFFVQDPTPDADPATSDGVFVYSTKAVKAGDRVLVTGKVTEYNGLTELSPATAVDVCGTGTVEPARVTLPLPKGVTAERYEGVLVRYPQRLTVSETYDLGRYGELTLSAGGRLFQPTDRRHKGTEADAEAANAARTLLIDDGSNVQNPATVPYSSPQVVRSGDSTRGLTGVLTYGFGTYLLEPTPLPAFDRTNPRPAKPRNVGGDVKVGSFNTLNWFTTLNQRGANTAAEQERQLAKLVAAVKGLNPDVAGLMEVENNGDTAIKALVDKLNEAVGAGTYTWVTGPNPGTDAIHVALIYKPAKVRPVGAAGSSDVAVFERPPLVQTFQPVRGGKRFTVIVNHFKSKGCTGATGADTDQKDGQSCFNARRVAQANAIVDLARTVENPLVLGDLNAYGEEDPIKTLEAGGLVEQAKRFIPARDRYSYVFDGLAGELDHVLAGKALSKRVTGTTIWHINADEATFLDYNTEYNQPQYYAPDPYRSSDHDPALIGLDLR
ncbi:ExeM/NucH family extracellular endonuclease [Actinomadura parmotrematis]|uniref:ExeM/NucH family extracellular endonuclease n=1 Tax=Actinomadura parmotrematis TaxID=2864039 RepID=A0ABS7FV00_9ACTN|nr:ExeM/NucH family extracellular endonuclease [Actinomadura parmotrematis]MBW8484156.1 ExeM/NucH family extracellular endonuclease [Actinomadura parmotrematis]